MSGTFTAIDSKTNKIAWQHQTPYRMGGGGGSTVTASRLLFRGDPDGNFLAIDAKTGEVLWRFQTGFGADAPAVVFEVDGDEYVAIYARWWGRGGTARCPPIPMCAQHVR
jgi:glucose dehydrogenase